MKTKVIHFTALYIVALLIQTAFAARIRHTWNIMPDPSYESKGIIRFLSQKLSIVSKNRKSIRAYVG